jgi:hypothetical protein
MAHFARIENGIVQQVIVVNNDVIQDSNGDEQESIGVAFCRSLYGAATEWVQTSYNDNFRKSYASVGYTYDAGRDAFIAPQPYDSWILDEDTCHWQAPIPYPSDGEVYIWQESTTSWVLANS